MIDPVISMNKCAGLNQSCIIHEQPKWLLKCCQVTKIVGSLQTVYSNWLVI